jgi:hypothetical protein
MEVYAPLGPTYWSAALACQMGGGGEPPFPLPSEVDKNNYVRLYFNKDHTGWASTGDGLSIAWSGTLSNGKYFNGKQYEYDDLKILLNVWDWKSGAKKEGTLDS